MYSWCMPPHPLTRFSVGMQPWVASFFLDCDAATSGMLDWRNPAGGAGDSVIECPNASAIAEFKSAVTNGSIFWQAFPHNAQPGTYEPSLFEASLDLGAWMADELGVSSGLSRAARCAQYPCYLQPPDLHCMCRLTSMR